MGRHNLEPDSSNNYSREEPLKQIPTKSTLLGFGFSRTCSDAIKNYGKRSLIIRIPKHVYEKAIHDLKPARAGTNFTEKPELKVDCSHEELLPDSPQNSLTFNSANVAVAKSDCS